MSANTTGQSNIFDADDLDVILSLLNTEDANGEQQSTRYLRLTRTLKATLLAKDTNISDSHSSTGHEIYSSLPTYHKAITTGDPFYVGISFASLGIAGLINYQGASEEDEFNIALAVWSEFRQNREASQKAETKKERDEKLHESFEILARRIRQFDHIFSRDQQFNAKLFESHHYDVVAKEKGIWQNPKKYRRQGLSYAQKTRRNIGKAFEGLTLTQAFRGAVDFSFHMFGDACKNWTYKSTYSDIREGFRVMPSYLLDFKFFSSGLREGKRPKPNRQELATVKRLEDHDAIIALVNSEKIPKFKLEEIAKKRRAIRRDIFNGKIMNAGFMLETAFVAVHAKDSLINGYKYSSQKFSQYLTDDHGDISLPFQLYNPTVHESVVQFLEQHAQSDSVGWALFWNVYSTAMVLGAYAFLGRNGYKIRENIRENEVFLTESYAEIEAAYNEEYGEPPEDNKLAPTEPK